MDKKEHMLGRKTRKLRHIKLLGAMKAILIQVALLVAFAIGLSFLFNGDSEYNYSLEFHGMEALDIEYISIEGDSGLVLHLAEKVGFDPMEGIRVDTFSAQASGYVNVSIHTQSGQTYSLNDMPFKSGKTNYIIKNGSELTYVKAHW